MQSAPCSRTAYVRDRAHPLTFSPLTVYEDRILRANNKIQPGVILEMQYADYDEIKRELEIMKVQCM